MVKHRHPDCMRCIEAAVRRGGPGIQLCARHAYESARRLDPERTGLVFDHPPHAVARQAVPLGECRNVAVLQAAESAFCGRPQRAVLFKSKIEHSAGTETVTGRVRKTITAVCKVDEASARESKPDATVAIRHHTQRQ